MTIQNGELLIDSDIKYVDCKHGDTTGRFMCVIDIDTGNTFTIIAEWDTVNRTELDVLFNLRQFVKDFKNIKTN
jgi:hypothetical protein